MFRNTLKTTVLFAGLGGLMVAIGSLFGRGGAIIGLALGFAIVGFSYWKSDSLAIRAARAVPADEASYPEYFAIMRELATRADMPMPQALPVPGAAAQRVRHRPQPEPRRRRDHPGPPRDLHAGTRSGVCSPTSCPTSATATSSSDRWRRRSLPGISFVANMAMWGAMFGGGRDDDEGGESDRRPRHRYPGTRRGGLLQMALSRSREFEADRTGADLIGDGEPLARALEKLEACAQRVPMDIQPAQAQAFIVNPLTGRQVSFANLFRTHPTTAERVGRLRAVS